MIKYNHVTDLLPEIISVRASSEDTLADALAGVCSCINSYTASMQKEALNNLRAILEAEFKIQGVKLSEESAKAIEKSFSYQLNHYTSME